MDAIGETTRTILYNKDSVRKHVCAWAGTTKDGDTVRTKLYNKIISNFEAGEVSDPVGGHFAECADCPNQHLWRTFLHPGVRTEDTLDRVFERLRNRKNPGMHGRVRSFGPGFDRGPL